MICADPPSNLFDFSRSLVDKKFLFILVIQSFLFRNYWISQSSPHIWKDGKIDRYGGDRIAHDDAFDAEGKTLNIFSVYRNL